MTNLNAKEIIKKLKQYFNLPSNKKLAEHLGINYATLSAWIIRDAFPPKILIEIALKYNISLDWLVKENDIKTLNKYDFILLPLITPQHSFSINHNLKKNKITDYFPFKKDLLKKLNINPENAFFTIAPNNAMSNTINKNDIILIDINERDVFESKIYAINYENSFILRQIEFSFPNKIIFKSENSKYSSFTISKEQLKKIKIIGTVKWVAREL